MNGKDRDQDGHQSQSEWDQPWRPEGAEGDWEWNEEDFRVEDNPENEAPSRGQRWVRRVILMLVAVALLGNVIAVIPLIYNSNVIQFLKVTQELSQVPALEAFKEAIVVVSAGERKGTGFNIKEDGLIVTNQHVVGDSKTAVIGFPDDRVYHADVVASDPAADLALLKLQVQPEEELPVLTVDPTSSWTEGMTIYYIGNPLFFRHIVGKGTVMELTDTPDKPMPVLLIDAPIYKGNSGSPVITEDGRVIGVIYATMNMTRDGEAIDAGLAIPTDHPFFEY